MNSLATIPFHGDKIYLVEHEGQPYVPARPIADNLGIDWKVQHRKLVSNPRRWSVVTMTTVAEDGRTREMVCLPLRKFPAWLLGIDTRKVKPEIRPKLELYQDESDTVLMDYWTKGHAENPRVATDTTVLSKDRYIELLEAENKLLKWPKRKNRLVCVELTNELGAKLYDMQAEGLSQRQMERETGISQTRIHYFLLHRPTLPLRGPQQHCLFHQAG